MRWFGEKAQEVSSPMGTIRIAVADRAAYYAIIAGPRGTRASKAEEDGFFDNCELLK